MNEVTNQGPHSANLRAAVVSSKPKAQKAVQSGNNLPPEKPKASSNVEHARQKANAKALEQMRENIDKAIAHINEYTQSTQRDIQFNLDEISGRTVVSVVDRESQEVVRQIPDEVFLKLARNLRESLENGTDETLQLISTKA